MNGSAATRLSCNKRLAGVTQGNETLRLLAGGQSFVLVHEFRLVLLHLPNLLSQVRKHVMRHSIARSGASTA